LDRLEKILAEIRAEARAEAEQILADARGEAEKLLEDARTQAKVEVDKIKVDAEQNVIEVQRSFKSSAELQKRQQILTQKRVLLAETLDKAKEELYALPENEYFDVLTKIVFKNVQSGNGILFLNKKDRERMPESFIKQIQSELPADCNLTVSEETRPIDGGFILAYGTVEENCSFTTIFSARADEFSDLVCDVLFSLETQDA